RGDGARERAGAGHREGAGQRGGAGDGERGAEGGGAGHFEDALQARTQATDADEAREAENTKVKGARAERGGGGEALLTAMAVSPELAVTVNLLVLTSRSPASELTRVTARVEESVVAPVTA